MKKAGMGNGLLAALVLAAPLAAGSDDHRRDFARDNRWEDRGRWEQRYDARHARHGDARGRHWERYRRGHGGRRNWHGRWWHYPRVHGWQQRGYPRWGYGPHGHDWRWDRRWGNGSFFTGALIGSTLTRGALHERGDHRYCDHDRRPIGDSARCYRVERLPDGRERRVPLPDRACF